MMNHGPRVKSIHVYPVKALAAVNVQQAPFDDLGLQHDRRFAVVDTMGRVLTQRDRAGKVMSNIIAAVSGWMGEHTLHLQRGNRTLSLPIAPHEAKTFHFNGGSFKGEDQGDGVARWLTIELGEHCRLIRVAHDFNRPPINVPKLGLSVRRALANHYPVLITSDESLREHNDNTLFRGEAARMHQFRPNIVVSGGTPRMEDRWRKIVISGVTLVWAAHHECCFCLNSWTGPGGEQRSPDTMRRLEEQAKAASAAKITFGSYYVPLTTGISIRAGAKVEVIEQVTDDI